MGTSFTNSIPRGQRKRSNEASQLRSQRDGDTTGRLWQKGRSVEQMVFGLAMAVEQLQKQVYRLRMRKSGEEAAGEAQDWFLGEWNDTMAVTAQQAVIFTPSGGQAGTYVCILDAPVGTEPSDATYYTLLPYPPPGVWSF